MATADVFAESAVLSADPLSLSVSSSNFSRRSCTTLRRGREWDEGGRGGKGEEGVGGRKGEREGGEGEEGGGGNGRKEG